MKPLKFFIAVKLSSYDLNNGYREWFEIQPQYDNDTITINMEHINEPNR